MPREGSRASIVSPVERGDPAYLMSAGVKSAGYAGPVIDPVCGMTVDDERPKGGKLVYRGREYGFCNPKCKARFEADPERWLAPKKAEVAASEWTCPMHPEIVRSAPGPC